MPPARVRAALIAAGTAILVIEHVARGTGGSASYPLPTTRLLNLQLAVFAILRFVRSDPDAAAYLAPSAADDPTFPRYVKEALGWPLVDLQVPARNLGMSDLLGLGDGSARLESATPFVSDLLRWFETQEPERFATEAGRELAAFLEPLRLLDAAAGDIVPTPSDGSGSSSSAERVTRRCRMPPGAFQQDGRAGRSDSACGAIECRTSWREERRSSG